jgi:hypothetical protein
MARGHLVRRYVVGLLGGGAAVFATSLAQAQCTMDTECKGDRVCDGGSCVAPKSGAATAARPTSQPAQTQPTPDAGAAEPADTKPAQPKMRRHSRGMMAGGIVMVSLAPVALLVAGFAGLGKIACGLDDYDRSRTCSGYDPVIYGSLAGALAVTIR